MSLEHCFSPHPRYRKICMLKATECIFEDFRIGCLVGRMMWAVAEGHVMLQKLCVLELLQARLSDKTIPQTLLFVIFPLSFNALAVVLNYYPTTISLLSFVLCTNSWHSLKPVDFLLTLVLVGVKSAMPEVRLPRASRSLQSPTPAV
jgi:hypothetical protein